MLALSREGGSSAYERGGDAPRKFWIKLLKETDRGVAQVFLTPKRDHVKTQTIYIFLYFYIFSRATLKRPLRLNIMAFFPEHPKWDQNPKFTALSAKRESPPPPTGPYPPFRVYCSQEVIIWSPDTQVELVGWPFNIDSKQWVNL